MKIEFEAVYIVWLREVKRYFRAKERIISSLAMPILWFLIFGIGMGSSFKFGTGVSYSVFLAPGIITMTLLFTSMFSGVSIIWDREFGFMKEMLVAPVSRLSIVIGRSLGGATTAVIQGMLILVLSILLGVEIALTSILLMIPLMVLISLGLVSLGITIASLIKNVESFGMIVNFIVMPMFLLSGALFPTDGLPDIFKIFVYLDPMAYGVETLRFVATGVSSIPFYISLPFVVIFSVITSLVGAYAFSRRE